MDISAEKMIFGVAGIDPERRAELIKVRWTFYLNFL
jgi:CCR4-NOT complex subunit CAF16